MVTVVKKLNYYSLLEDHHNVGTAEKEITHFLAFLYVVADFQRG